MEISEFDYRLLFAKIIRLKVDELMQEPYDDDMKEDDFFEKSLTGSGPSGMIWEP